MTLYYFIIIIKFILFFVIMAVMRRTKYLADLKASVTTPSVFVSIAIFFSLSEEKTVLKQNLLFQMIFCAVNN